MSTIELADRKVNTTAATLELFHLFAVEAGWTLEVALDGAPDRLVLEGRVPSPALPGPSELTVWYVDAPRVVTIDGVLGALSVGPRALDGGPARRSAGVTLRATGAGCGSVGGTFELVWEALGTGVIKPYLLRLDLPVALVT